MKSCCYTQVHTETMVEQNLECAVEQMIVVVHCYENHCGTFCIAEKLEIFRFVSNFCERQTLAQLL